MEKDTIYGTKGAIKRLAWRFKTATEKYGNKLLLKQEDLDALYQIDDYFIATEKGIFEQNELFAKLYIHHLIQLTDRGTDILSTDTGGQWMDDCLAKPLEQLLEELQKSLNQCDLYLTFKGIEGERKTPEAFAHVHPSHYQDMVSSASTKEQRARIIAQMLEDRRKRESAIREMMEKHPEAFEMATWDYETTKDIAIGKVNEQIHKHFKSK